MHVTCCRMSADLGSLVGLAGELNSVSSGSVASSLSSAGSLNQSFLPPCPFALPSIYEEAKGAKVDSVAELRMAVKSVSPWQAATSTSHMGSWAAQPSSKTRGKLTGKLPVCSPERHLTCNLSARADRERGCPVLHVFVHPGAA